MTTYFSIDFFVLAQSEGEFMKGKTESSQHRHLPKSANHFVTLCVCVFPRGNQIVA